MNACRSCGASILWATTPGGIRIPLDAEPRDDGNVVLTRDGTAINVGPVPPINRPRYASHFVTCPQAAEHRRRR